MNREQQRNMERKLPEGRFSGLRVLITGAAGGIGRRLAEAYAERGARVAMTDLADTDGERLARAMAERGTDVVFFPADLRRPDEIVRLFDQADETFGGIDILINNAGRNRVKSPLELSVEEWDEVLDVNLRGAFLCAREAARRMVARREGGSIVNIASTRAVQSEADTEAYAASKGGLLALTHALAVSLGRYRIRVNAVCPGWIETGDYAALRDIDHAQHPAGRVGRPEDVARACFYLTDPENDFVTGTALFVDGGMTRKMIYEP
jgi:NAD(P)-dependent dehydrogenase (short-subunit alcohol dehydrogenase family)